MSQGKNCVDGDAGWTPLRHAIEKGCYLSLVRKLVLDDGADVNAKTPTLWTALHFAARGGSAEIIRFLLEHGAEIDAGDCDGWTALHVASMNDHVAAVESLLRKGALLDARCKNGWAAIHFAAWKGFVAVVELLIHFPTELKRSALIEARSNGGSTAMHLAAEEGHVAVVKLLVAFDADLDVRDDCDWFDTHYRDEFAEAVVQDQRRYRGLTPLMRAIDKQQSHCVQLLLDLDVDVSRVQRRLRSFYQPSTFESLLSQHKRKSPEARAKARVETLTLIHLPRLAGVCMAMSALELPPYVLLWIIDWLPNYERLSHRKKILLITAVRDSVWKIQEQRQQRAESKSIRQ